MQGNKARIIIEQVRDAIVSGKETKAVRALRRYPWQDIQQGLYFAQGIYKGIEYLESTGNVNDSQFELAHRYMERIRAAVLRLSPEVVLKLGGEMAQLIFENVIDPLHSIIFGTEQGEIESAVAVISLITRARALLPPFASDDERGSSEEIETTNSILGIGVIFGCLVEASLGKVSFTWDNFLEATAEEDPRALECWKILFYSHAFMGGFELQRSSEAHKRFGPLVFAQMTYKEMLLTHRYLNGELSGPVLLPVPDELYERVVRIIVPFVAEKEQPEQELAKTILRFIDQREEFLALEKMMWEEIVERPRYGLRSTGDRVQLDIAVLRQSDIQHEAVVLTPLSPFPWAQVKVWTRLLGKPVSRMFIFAPEYASWRENNEWKELESMKHAMDELLYFISLQCYWEIVMGRGTQDEQEGFHINVQQAEQRVRLKRSADELISVRPHFRRLRPGAKASRWALAAAQEKLGVSALPVGRTFVQEYERGWQEMQEIPPVFTYTEEDMQSWGIL